MAKAPVHRSPGGVDLPPGVRLDGDQPVKGFEDRDGQHLTTKEEGELPDAEERVNYTLSAEEVLRKNAGKHTAIMGLFGSGGRAVEG